MPDLFAEVIDYAVKLFEKDFRAEDLKHALAMEKSETPAGTSYKIALIDPQHPGKADEMHVSWKD